MRDFVMDGYVQSQIEDRTARNGRVVTKFAVNSPDYDPQSGTRTPNYFDVEYWHDAQDDRRQSVQEGALLVLWGRFRQDRWQDKQTGQNRSRVIFEARAIAVERAPQPRQCQPQGYQQEAYAAPQPAYPAQQPPRYGAQRPATAPAPVQPAYPPQQPAQAQPPAMELYDEDIPF